MLLAVNPASVALGVSGGLSLAFTVVAFAVVGLGPWFTWVPDVAFVAAAGAVGVISLATTGARARGVTSSVREGANAAALAGAIGGLAAGICYVAFGRGLANLVILPTIGAVGGAIVGTAAAWWRR